MSQRTDYFVLRNGIPRGPFTSSQLKELAESGELRADDLVRKSTGAWITVSRVRGLCKRLPESVAVLTDIPFKLRPTVAATTTTPVHLPETAARSLASSLDTGDTLTSFPKTMVKQWNTLERMLRTFVLRVPTLSSQWKIHLQERAAPALASARRWCTGITDSSDPILTNFSTLGPALRKGIANRRNQVLAVTFMLLTTFVTVVPIFLDSNTNNRGAFTRRNADFSHPANRRHSLKSDSQNRNSPDDSRVADNSALAGRLTNLLARGVGTRFAESATEPGTLPIDSSMELVAGLPADDVPLAADDVDEDAARSNEVVQSHRDDNRVDEHPLSTRFSAASANQFLFQEQEYQARQYEIEQQIRQSQTLADEYYFQAQQRAEYDAQRATNRYRNQMSGRMGALGVQW